MPVSCSLVEDEIDRAISNLRHFRDIHHLPSAGSEAKEIKKGKNLPLELWEMLVFRLHESDHLGRKVDVEHMAKAC